MPRLRAILPRSILISLLAATPAFGQSDASDQTLPDLDVVSRRLDQARSQIQPSLGATRYDFSHESLQTIPEGDNTPQLRPTV
jgi:hypothetical protein